MSINAKNIVSRMVVNFTPLRRLSTKVNQQARRVLVELSVGRPWQQLRSQRDPHDIERSTLNVLCTCSLTTLCRSWRAGWSNSWTRD